MSGAIQVRTVEFSLSEEKPRRPAACLRAMLWARISETFRDEFDIGDQIQRTGVRMSAIRNAVKRVLTCSVSNCMRCAPLQHLFGSS